MRKPIKNFEGIYEISDEGYIITLKRDKYIKEERQTKGYKNKKGYLEFDFRRQGGTTKLVHRLVAEAFIPNPNDLPQINHKDGNKTNNRVDNLEWCDNSYNQKHAFENGLQKGNFYHPNSKLTYDDVMYIKKHYIRNKRGSGLHSLAKKFGVCDTTIKQILRGDSYKNIK